MAPMTELTPELWVPARRKSTALSASAETRDAVTPPYYLGPIDRILPPRGPR